LIDKVSLESTFWLPKLLRLWALFALVTFGVMLLHQSDDALFLGRYSLIVTAQLATLLLTALALWGTARYLTSRPQLQIQMDAYLHRWRQKRVFAPLVVFLACCIVVGVWIFFLGNHLPTYAFLRMFLAASVCIATLALLYGGTTSKAVHANFLVYGLVSILILIIFVTLPYFPALANTDEAFVLSMARNALETGQYRPQILKQAFPEYYYGGIWIWMMAGWLKIVNVSFIAGRLYVLLVGVISLGFLYVGTAKLYDRLTAWFVVLLGVYSFATLNHIRFDIHSALWLSIAIFFYSRAQPSGRWWMHLATGFTIGMCIDSNPISYCFGLGLFFVYSWDYIQYLRQKRGILYRPFFWMLLGGALALLLYLQLHSGASFAQDQTTGDMLSFYSALIQSNFLTGAYVNQLYQYLSAFLTTQPILFGVMLLGIVTALRERTRYDILFLTMYFTWMAAIVFTFYYFPRFYLTLGLPIFLILGARGLARGLPHLLGIIGDKSSALAYSTSILIAVWLIAALAHGLRQLPSQSLEDVVEAGRRIADIVPQEATIVAAEAYYFGMLNHRNFVAGVIEATLGAYFDTPPESVWQEIQPDAIVFSEGWSTEPRRSRALLAYMERENFGLQACYETLNYGRVELWMSDTSSANSDTATCTVVCNPRTGC
jgi:hypothetical protein